MKEKKQKYERKKVEDKTRNNNFAAALDYLKRQSKERLYQKDLAEMLNVTENTISNIIHYRTVVSEDMITQLQSISGCVFNLQWLRGQSDVMLAADLAPAAVTGAPPSGQPSLPDYSSMVNAVIAAKDDAITSLKRELASKDETIAAKDALIATKDTLIDTLQRQLNDLRTQIAIEKGVISSGYPFAPGVAEHEQHRPTL